MLGNSQTDRHTDILIAILRHRMAEANALVRVHARKRTAEMKQHYDRVVRPTTFEPGDLVRHYYRRKLKGISPKWSRYYVGPYLIVKRVNDVNYVIHLNDRTRAIIVHVNKLKPYYEFSGSNSP